MWFFQPVIFESTGGVPAEAQKLRKCLTKAVAGNIGASEVVVAMRFWQRTGIDLLRDSARAFHIRRVDEGRGDCGVGGLLLAAAGLAAPVGAQVFVLDWIVLVFWAWVPTRIAPWGRAGISRWFPSRGLGRPANWGDHCVSYHIQITWGSLGLAG